MCSFQTVPLSVSDSTSESPGFTEMALPLWGPMYPVSEPAKLLYWPEIHQVEYGLGWVVGARVGPHDNSACSVPKPIGKNVGFVGFEPEQHGTSPGQMMTAPVAGGAGGTVSVVVSCVIAFGYGTDT